MHVVWLKGVLIDSFGLCLYLNLVSILWRSIYYITLLHTLPLGEQTNAIMRAPWK